MVLINLNNPAYQIGVWNTKAYMTWGASNDVKIFVQLEIVKHNLNFKATKPLNKCIQNIFIHCINVIGPYIWKEYIYIYVIWAL